LAPGKNKEKAMDQIDKKIETSMLNNLDALSKAIPTLSIDELRSEVDEKLDCCTKTELTKLLKKIIKWERDHLNLELIDQDVLNED
jgi:hypothetical protein